MLDIKYIREHREEVAQAAKYKRVQVDIDALLELDETMRSIQQELHELQAERNALSKNLKGAPDPIIIEQGKQLKEKITSTETTYQQTKETFDALLKKVPNIISPKTPIGKDDTENKVVRTWGGIPQFDFKIHDHIEIGRIIDGIDTETSATVTGSRFAYLKNEVALMQFGLVQLAFNTLTSQETIAAIIKQFAVPTTTTKSFVPVVPPVMIKPEVFARMARLSEEDKDERYYLPADDMYLVGSAEHTLGPMYMDTIIESDQLPIRMIGYSSAFRREAGSYGKDVRGILRVHQFDKLEMEVFSTPDDGEGEQELLVAIQEYFLQQLQLPYQVVEVCTGDIGKPDFRQIDIETWIPSQGMYRETHSADYMTDYQSRRLKTRTKINGATEYVHMNDATCFAIGRMLIAILENNQQEDGSILVPAVLQPYVGVDIIPARHTAPAA